MEKLALVEEKLFSSLILPAHCESKIKEKTLYITKWNWKYEEFLDFQEKAHAFIVKNRSYRIFIFCNHPHCFTIGRGNERGDKSLVDFDEDLTSELKYPVHKIHRGGGITFHFPGQWIFYPIVSIKESYTLEDHMCWLLRSVKDVLVGQFDLKGAMATKKLMGVWINRNKIASIGVGVNRFVTLHGLALNLCFDKMMFEEIQKINPCGMSTQTYITLDQLANYSSSNLVQSFHEYYLKNQLGSFK